MKAIFEQIPASFVVVFFLNGQGEMCCRVTDVGAHETWVVDSAQALWRLIIARPIKDADAPKRAREIADL